MTGWLGQLAVLSPVGLVLVAEAGLLVGVVLPGTSLVIGLGVLAGAGLVPAWAAAVTAAGATVLGAVLGHRSAAAAGGGRLLPADGVLRRALPRRAVRVVDRSAARWGEVVGRRPVGAAATAQFVAGARTLAPRLAAASGTPLRTLLRGTVPAALVWSSALVAAGATAGAALPWLRGALAVAGLPLVVAATGLLVLRRRTRARSATRGAADVRRVDGGPDPRRGRRDPGAGRALGPAVLLAVLGVAVLTLAPTGRPGWAWGSPLLELCWYVTGLDRPTTLVQLLGNLVLLAVPTALAALRWPALGTPLRLAALVGAAAGGIEGLQWALPLGRVVSPIDAALNITGALVVGALAVRLRNRPRRGCCPA